MDTIRTLLDKQEYDLVIKLTEKADDVDSLFCRISAFLSLDKNEQALECLKMHRKTLENRLATLIRTHMALLILLGKFDEAYDELLYYQNLPYVSQEVEEILASMSRLLREEEKKNYQKESLSDDEIRSRLNSSEQNIVLSGLDLAGSRGVDKFYVEIERILKNFPIQSIRSFALMLLVQKKVQREFLFNSKGNVIKVVPANIKPPFIGEPFESVTRKIISEYKNPTISDNAIDILSGYIIDIYPNEVDIAEDYIVGALYVLSSSCLQIKDAPTIEEYALMHKLDKDKLLEAYKLFERIVKSF